MDNNVIRFINAFTRIEKYMKTLVQSNNYTKFYRLVEMCKKKNYVVKINYHKLLDYSSLRNVIVHQRDDEDNVLAIPTDNVVEDIERIADNIEGNKKVIEFASLPIITVNLDETVKDAYLKLVEIGTSKIPVYDNSRYVGLITLENITEAFYNHEQDKKVEDIVFNTKNKVVFCDKDDDVEVVIEAFEESVKKGNVLKAVIVIDEGKPVGIITAYDLPKILGFFI